MSSTETARDVLVDPAWIAEHLDDPAVSIIEVDVSPAAYDAGHVPGALLWDAYSDLRHPNYIPIDAADFAALASRSGLTHATTVVFYGYAAHLGFWLMKRYGHATVRLMDGSRDRWALAGHPWSTETPMPPASGYSPAEGTGELEIGVDELMATGDGRGPVILDVRSDAEFTGEQFWPSGAAAGAGRAGHIPGAVHMPHEELRDQAGEFKRPRELRELFSERGVVPERGVVTYCTIGNRAAQAWFALAYLLDFPAVRVYYGSWAEWGTLPETPVAT